MPKNRFGSRSPPDSSRFPRLYEKNPCVPLTKAFVPDNKQEGVILIHHANEPFEPYVRALSRGYHIEKIICIPYSAIGPVVDRLNRDFDISVASSSEEIIDQTLSTVRSADRDLIIQEIGGYTSEIERKLKASGRVLGVVEDTNQGLWRWKANGEKRLPVFSIANSELKRVEDIFIGMSIADATDIFLQEYIGESLDNKTVQTVGFGNIGQPTTHFLQEFEVDLLVDDTDPIQMLKADAMYTANFDLNQADVVIGLTGAMNGSVMSSDLSSLSSDLILVSGSSRQVEFDLTGFKSAASRHKKSDLVWQYFINDCKVAVANAGRPINFRFSYVPSFVLDLPFAGLVHGTNQIARGDCVLGINEISWEDEIQIAEQYTRIYEKGYDRYES